MKRAGAVVIAAIVAVIVTAPAARASTTTYWGKGLMNAVLGARRTWTHNGAEYGAQLTAFNELRRPKYGIYEYPVWHVYKLCEPGKTPCASPNTATRNSNCAAFGAPEGCALVSVWHAIDWLWHNTSGPMPGSPPPTYFASWWREHGHACLYGAAGGVTTDLVKSQITSGLEKGAEFVFKKPTLAGAIAWAIGGCAGNVVKSSGS